MSGRRAPLLGPPQAPVGREGMIVDMVVDQPPFVELPPAFIPGRQIGGVPLNQRADVRDEILAGHDYL